MIFPAFSLVSPFFSHQFNGFFSTDVFYGKFQHTQRSKFPVNGLVSFLLRLLWGILPSQLFNGSPFFLFTFQNADFHKDDHTAEIGGIFLRHDLVLINDAERVFFIPLYGFYLISISGTVEKNILLIVKITEGDCIRIALCSLQGQYA